MGSVIPPAPLRRIDVGEVSLAVTEQGAGELVVLLHGFPERAHTWRHQLRALADGGFRAAAPDMRGFGDSDRPLAVEAYALERLVDDVAGLITALGAQRAHVVGHDWGGVVAWAVAALRPERVATLTAMNAPHLVALHEELQAPEGGQQRMMAWYMLLYQFSGIAEELCARGDFAFLRARLARAPAGAFHAGDIEHFLAPMRSPGARTAGLNYYRALVPPSAWLEPPPAFPPVTAPTLVIWGLEDRALHRRTLERSLEAAAGPLRVERLEGVGHYVQNEVPDVVNRHLLAFLAMHCGRPVDGVADVRTPPPGS
jgi:pimeloyl-ACP methyl ester carboxylesterase